jgi:hypothetical protein
MKKASFSSIFLALTLAAMLLSACGGASQSAGEPAGGGKGLASPVEFTGVIENMDGDQWTINGQVVTVDPSVLRDGPFNVGDPVKVEAQVQSDGSIVVTRIERYSPDDNSNINGDDNSNGNVNANVNGNANSNANGNSNANINGNTNANGNANTNGNVNSNANGNSNANINGNTNANGNANTNANFNSNDNSNDDDDNDNDDNDNDDDDNDNDD